MGLVTNLVTFMPQILSILQTRMRKFINNYFILANCTTCRKKHSENVAQETEWLYPKEPKDKSSPQRCVENTIRFEDKPGRGKNPFYYHLW